MIITFEIKVKINDISFKKSKAGKIYDGEKREKRGMKKGKQKR